MNYFANFEEVFLSVTPQDFWSITFLSNELRFYALAGAVFLLASFVFWLIQKVVILRLEHISKSTKNDVDDLFANIVGSIRTWYYGYLAFYFSIKILSFGDVVDRVLDSLLLILTTYQIVAILGEIIDYFVNKFLFSSEESSGEAKSAANLIGKIAKVAVWIFGILMVLSNFGINVTTLVAGLGIGGIAIAFALQKILEDLFSSFAIFFDKPFQVGDFVVVGPDMGTVEKIGIKTTRIRALGGEELVIANKDLTSSRVQNFKQMERRRALLRFGVVYETSNKKMEKIPGMIEKIIKGVGEVDFDRAHFASFDDSALTYEVVYYVNSAEYDVYMDVQEQINLEIKKAFEKEKISMAYPTTTVYLNKN